MCLSNFSDKYPLTIINGVRIINTAKNAKHFNFGDGCLVPVKEGWQFFQGGSFSKSCLGFWGHHFQVRHPYLRWVISINLIIKVVQSNKEHELKLNVTTVKSKHQSYKYNCLDEVCGEF